MKQNPKKGQFSTIQLQTNLTKQKPINQGSTTVVLKTQGKTKLESLPKIRNQKQLKKELKQLLTPQLYGQTNMAASQARSIGDKEATFLDRYEWLYKQSNYSQVKFQQVHEENKRLRNALIRIDQQVDNIMRKLQPKIQKSINKLSFITKNRIKTDGILFGSQKNPSEHRKQIQTKEASNNEFMIRMYKKQFKKLKMRQKYLLGYDQEQKSQQNHSIDNSSLHQQSNTVSLTLANSRRRQRLQSSIQETHDSISKIKRVNKNISQKSKEISNSIHNTDEYILSMRRLQFYVELELKNKLRLQSKLSQSQKSITQIYKKIHQIKNQYQSAEQYFRKNRKQYKDIEQNKDKQQTIRKKQQLKVMMQKKLQAQTQNKQVLYHNLLKNLDLIVQNTKSTQQKIEEAESQNLSLKNEIKTLQVKLNKIKMIKQQKMNKNKVGLLLITNDLLTQSDKNNSIFIDQQRKVQKSKSKVNDKKVYYQDPAINSTGLAGKKEKNPHNDNQKEKQGQTQTNINRDNLNLKQYNQVQIETVQKYQNIQD